MLKLIKQLLIDIINKIDAGNSNLTEEEAIKVVEYIRQFADPVEDFSKQSAARYLGISRATFDNKVRSGELPKGKHKLGFKELRWYKKDLDDYIKNIKSS